MISNLTALAGLVLDMACMLVETLPFCFQKTDTS